MKFLITGCAGFIGYHLCQKLIKQKKYKIVGIDNLNSYYDVNLKKNRLENLYKNKNFVFLKININNSKQISEVLKEYKFDIVINLAAQAGIRYSFKKPDTYIKSNIVGFYNILNQSRLHNIKHLLYASSSSVYGNSKNFPLNEKQITDNPISLYAATKKTNEILASTFSKLYQIPITGMRFFTVYGPYGRPDMAIFKFVHKINNNKNINLYNYGNNLRDYTYIDDVITIIKKIINRPINKKNINVIYNIGNNKPISTNDLVKVISNNLKIKPKITLSKSMKGDTIKTHADITKLKNHFNYHPATNIELGIKKFIDWYKKYYY